MSQISTATSKIRELNDLFRKTRIGGHVLITRGIQGLSDDGILRVLNMVSNYDNFTPDNDPHEEHDFGKIDFEGHKIYWKIDYYDKDLKFGSEDPSDLEVTKRVLTVMLSGEY